MQESPAPENSPIGVPWSLTDMALGVGAMVGSFLIFLLLLRPLVTTEDEGSRVLALIWLGAAIEGLPIYVIWRLSVKKYGVGWDALGFQRPRTRRNVILVLATIIGCLVLIAVYVALVTQLDIDFLIPEPVPEGLGGDRATYRLLTAMAIAGWVPFVEEIFFRGFMFQGLASRYGMLWGAVFSSGLFALAHIVIGTMIPIFLIGLMFAFLHSRTRSIWMPMAAHGTFNLIVLSVSG